MTHVFEILGVGLLCYGLWLAWPPLAFIAAGSLSMAMAYATMKERGGL